MCYVYSRTIQKNSQQYKGSSMFDQTRNQTILDSITRTQSKDTRVSQKRSNLSLETLRSYRYDKKSLTILSNVSNANKTKRSDTLSIVIFNLSTLQKNLRTRLLQTLSRSCQDPSTNQQEIDSIQYSSLQTDSRSTPTLSLITRISRSNRSQKSSSTELSDTIEFLNQSLVIETSSSLQHSRRH